MTMPLLTYPPVNEMRVVETLDAIGFAALVPAPTVAMRIELRRPTAA